MSIQPHCVWCAESLFTFLSNKTSKKTRNKHVKINKYFKWVFHTVFREDFYWIILCHCGEITELESWILQTKWKLWKLYRGHIVVTRSLPWCSEEAIKAPSLSIASFRWASPGNRSGWLVPFGVSIYFPEIYKVQHHLFMGEMYADAFLTNKKKNDRIYSTVPNLPLEHSIFSCYVKGQDFSLFLLCIHPSSYHCRKSTSYSLLIYGVSPYGGDFVRWCNFKAREGLASPNGCRFLTYRKLWSNQVAPGQHKPDCMNTAQHKHYIPTLNCYQEASLQPGAFHVALTDIKIVVGGTN